MPGGPYLRLPADLLITGDGRAAAVKYGAHTYDQWSVDELFDAANGLSLLKARPVTPTRVAQLTGLPGLRAEQTIRRSRILD
jgi:hypothetical protein